ncbi:hypothetical protein BHE74_00003499 [Ensete ventricosum]|nr:hypothetical protein BHE74_00003499 [Ensete ventricosum]
MSIGPLTCKSGSTFEPGLSASEEKDREESRGTDILRVLAWEESGSKEILAERAWARSEGDIWEFVGPMRSKE